MPRGIFDREAAKARRMANGNNGASGGIGGIKVTLGRPQLEALIRLTEDSLTVYQQAENQLNEMKQTPFALDGDEDTVNQVHAEVDAALDKAIESIQHKVGMTETSLTDYRNILNPAQTNNNQTEAITPPSLPPGTKRLGK